MEKKLVSVGLRIEESVLLKAKALAEHSGITPKGVAKLSLLFAHKMACDASAAEV